MERRTFVQAGVAGGAVTLAGCSHEKAAAINVEEPKPLDDAEFDFGEETSLGWLSERFMENHSQENPIFGNDYTVEGVVVFNSARESRVLQVVDFTGWTIVERLSEGFGIDRVFPLVSPLFEWLSDQTGEYYENVAALQLAGIQDADQRHYDKYGKVPQVLALFDSTLDRDEGEFPAGTAVRVTGTLDWKDENEVHPYSGPYFAVEEIEATDEYPSTLDVDTGSGERASFLGLQRSDGPTLTDTRVTRTSYEPQSGMPFPTGGSLVRIAGPATDIETDFGRVRSATIETDEQQVIVGDLVHERPWSDGESEGDDRGTGGGGGGEGDAPANTVCVVDVSGSMGDTDTESGRSRLEIAKASAGSLVNYVRDGNRFGLVTFSSGSRTVAPLRDIGGVREEVLASIDGLSANSGTSIGGGLRRAFRELRDVGGPKTIVLLSDGQENTAPYADDVLPEIVQHGITVYTIGMGETADVGLLERIARRTGGESRYAPDPGGIKSFYHRFSVAAQDRSRVTADRIELTEGDQASGGATVDQTSRDAQFSLSYPGSEIRLDVTAPDGSPLSPDSDSVTHRVGPTSEVWTVDDPQTGEWQYDVTAEQLSEPEEATVEVSVDSPVDAELFVSDGMYEHTGLYKVELLATVGRQRYTGADVTLRASDGETNEEFPLREDGVDADPVARDGIYTGYFHPSDPGEYDLAARIVGGGYADVTREFQESIVVEETVDEPVRFYDTGGGFDVGKTGVLVGTVLLLVAVFWGTLRSLGGGDDAE